MKPIVFFSYVLTPLVRVLLWTKIKGKENLPKTDGPVIFCANHFSNWDPPVVSTSCRLPYRYIAKKSLFTKPVLGSILKWFGCIPVERDSRDVASLRTAISAAKEGQPVMIFPQGKRIKGTPPQPDEAKKGIALMIAMTNATVVPMGLYTKGYKARIFRRYYVNIGEPITPEMYRPLLDEGDKATRFDRVTEMIFGRVCELAKPENAVKSDK